MTIASAITAAQGRVADCYTSVDTMGGTLPEVQNLTNLPAAIESIPQGGGDTVLAHRSIADTLEIDDKVLIKYSIPTVTKKQEYNIAATSSSTGGQTYVQPVWFNNNLFCVFAGFNNSSGYVGSFAYAYNGSTWNKTALTGVHDISSGGIYMKFVGSNAVCMSESASGDDRYTITSSGSKVDKGTTNFRRNFVYEDDTVKITTGYQVSGSTHGEARGIWINETTQINNTYALKGHFYDPATHNLLVTVGLTSPRIYTINSDFTAISVTYTSSDIPNTSVFVGCTGLAEGDYVFYAANNSVDKLNNMSNYNNTPASTYGTVASSYSVFKVGSDYKLHAISSDDTLYPYINIDKSLWRFDNRNNCLVIGTTSDVYILEFKNGTWTLIASNMPLPSNNSGAYIYNASLSPDKSKLAVYAGDTNQYAQNLFIYDIGSGYTWTVVKNSAQNYDNVLAFTGIFKGRMYNTETQEYFDMVSTVLPPDGTVICSLTSDYEPELSIL
jgi:hypothetical protein